MGESRRADEYLAECPDFRMNAVFLSDRWSRIRHRVWSLNGDVAGREPVDADAGTDNLGSTGGFRHWDELLAIAQLDSRYLTEV